MKKVYVALTLLILGCEQVSAAPQKFTSADKTLFMQEEFKPVQKVSDLPQSVRDDLKITLKPKNMADPNENFSAGCTGGPDLPYQRMLLAGISKDFCVIHFERGGIAHYYVARMYKLVDDKYQQVAAIGLKDKVKTLPELLERIKQQKSDPVPEL